MYVFDRFMLMYANIMYLYNYIVHRCNRLGLLQPMVQFGTHFRTQGVHEGANKQSHAVTASEVCMLHTVTI
jgi:hypothetical protein